MKKLILLPILLFSFDFKQAFKEKKYAQICVYGKKHIQKIKDENVLSLIGLSCAKSDYFIYLPYVINNLKLTKKGRKNSLYFSILFFEKKLLQAYLFDNIDISYYQFPMVNHPISIVYTNIYNKNFTKKNGVIIVKYKDKIYKIYTKGRNFYIDEYKNNKLIKKHWYQ